MYFIEYAVLNLIKLKKGIQIFEQIKFPFFKPVNKSLTDLNSNIWQVMNSHDWWHNVNSRQLSKI